MQKLSLTEVFEVVFLCGPIQLHHCGVQDIIRFVAVVHALHPECDPQVFLLEHKSFHIHERLRNNTTKLLGVILLRLGAETREDMHRDLHPHREKAIHASFGRKSCVASVLDARRNFKFQRGVFGICCDVVHQVARESSENKPIIVNADPELLVQRRENRPSLRLFVLTLALCKKIRRQLCHQVPDERRQVGAKPRG